MWFASYTLKQCTRILKTFVLCMYMLHIPHNLILCVNGCHVQACDLTLKCTYLPLKSQSHKQFGGSCLCNKLLVCMQKEAVHVHCERRFIFAFLIEKEKKKKKKSIAFDGKLYCLATAHKLLPCNENLCCDISAPRGNTKYFAALSSPCWSR